MTNRMDKENLIQYLRYVVELEKQVYLQKRALNELDAKINSLGRSCSFQEPQVGRAGKPEYGNESAKWAFIGVIIGFVAALISCDWVGNLNAIFSFIGYAILYPLIGGVVGAFIGFIVADIQHSNRQKELNLKYKYDMQEYETAKYNDAVRVKREIEQRNVIISERTALYSQYRSTQKTLDKVYSIGVIYGKYRTFPAVASFLDYFESGRCSTLGENTGGDGAYNKYDNESRLDLIVTKLDEVIVQLDNIKDNQWTMYQAISEGNNVSRRLVDATTSMAITAKAIEENSAIAAYNAQRSADDINIIKWIQIFNG